MIPSRFAPVAFGFVLSGLMSFLVSGIATWRHAGLLTGGFVDQWLAGWLASWPVAFPVVLVVAPVARRIVQRLVAV